MSLWGRRCWQDQCVTTKCTSPPVTFQHQRLMTSLSNIWESRNIRQRSLQPEPFLIWENKNKIGAEKSLLLTLGKLSFPDWGKNTMETTSYPKGRKRGDITYGLTKREGFCGGLHIRGELPSTEPGNRPAVCLGKHWVLSGNRAED